MAISPWSKDKPEIRVAPTGTDPLVGFRDPTSALDIVTGLKPIKGSLCFLCRHRGMTTCPYGEAGREGLCQSYVFADIDPATVEGRLAAYRASVLASTKAHQ